MEDLIRTIKWFDGSSKFWGTHFFVPYGSFTVENILYVSTCFHFLYVSLVITFLS